MICAIMQPTYWPWIGYFSLIDQVDTFIFLDNVKLEKSDWHVRNRVKAKNAELMLTINVSLPNGRLNTNINEATINTNRPWRKKHLKSLETCYKKSPYFEDVFPFAETLIDYETDVLSEFTGHIITQVASKIGIRTNIKIASELKDITGVKDERLVSLCRNAGCDAYLSPPGSAAYLEEHSPGGALVRDGIDLYYQAFEHPPYPQINGDFISHLGVIDLLFNVGFEGALEVIRTGQKPMKDYLTYRTELGL